MRACDCHIAPKWRRCGCMSDRNATNKLPPSPCLLCSQEKLELADGRHRIEWYLLDEADDAHLAVVGECLAIIVGARVELM